MSRVHATTLDGETRSSDAMRLYGVPARRI